MLEICQKGVFNSFNFSAKSLIYRSDSNTLMPINGTLMKSVFNLLLLTLLFWPLAAFAELPDNVASDFAVVEGVVVMPISDEYIIDLDARDGLNVSDVLTLVTPGEKIFHPVSKEVIGTVDNVVGFLQVTRIHSGYSYVRVLSEGLQPNNGARIKRFEQVPVRFVDNTEKGGELVRELKVNLPQFEWLAKDESERALLTFTLQDKLLEVRDLQENSLHRYTITEDHLLVDKDDAGQRPTVVTQSKPLKPLQKFANSVISSLGGTTNQDRFAEMDEAIIRQKQRDRQGIWMGPNIDGNPRVMAVADLDGDGRQEIAMVIDSRLLVARIIDGVYSEVAEITLPIRLQLLTMDAVDLDGNGRPELYLSALDRYAASSFVIEWTGEDYAITLRNVSWLLRAVTFPGEESPTLLGQRKAEDEQPFFGRVYKMDRDGDSLVEGEALELPSELNVFNFLPMIDERGRLNYVYSTQGDYLKVRSAEGVQMWESSQYFGGSEICYFPRPEYSDEMMQKTCMPQRKVMMPQNEILVAQNEGQRFIKNLRIFKNSRLVALGWNGYTLQESWRTASQSGYLADFAAADADNDGNIELVQLVRFQSKGLMNSARSSIVIYELE